LCNLATFQYFSRYQKYAEILFSGGNLSLTSRLIRSNRKLPYRPMNPPIKATTVNFSGMGMYEWLLNFESGGSSLLVQNEW
jgi:hypothetical protein